MNSFLPSNLKHFIRNDIPTTSPDTLVLESLEKMDLNQLSTVVIVDGKKPVGIVTEREIVSLIANHSQYQQCKVKECMSKAVISEHLKMDFLQLNHFLAENKCRQLIVTNDEGELAGLITETDLMKHLNPKYFEDYQSIASVMNSHVITVDANDTLLHAANLLVKHNINFVCVVTEKTVLGTISEKNIVKLFHQNPSASETTIYSVMTKSVITLYPYESLAKAISLMNTEQTSRVIIIDDNNELLGCITHHDILENLRKNYLNYLQNEIDTQNNQLMQLSSQLKDSQRRLHYKNIMDHINDAVFILDKGLGHIIDTNGQVTSMLGYSQDELLQMYFNEISELVENEHDWQILRIELSKAKLLERKSHLTKKNGDKLLAHFKFSWIENEDNMFILVVIKDITQYHQKKKELEKIERRFSHLTDVSPVGIFINDLKGICLYANEQTQKITGLSQSKFLKHGWQHAIYPDDQKRIKITWQKTINKRKPFHQQYRFQHTDKTIVWVSSDVTPEIDTEGNISGYIGTFVDITELKNANFERERLFELSLDLLCIAGLDGYFKQLNSSWKKVLGWNRNELLHEPLINFVHPDDREKTHNAKQDILSGERLVQFENRCRTKQGDYIWLQWRALPVSENRLIYATARDVTEYKQLKNLLSSQQNHLTDAFGSQGLNTEQRLQESEQRWQYALQLAKDVFFDWDICNDNIYISEQWMTMLGYSTENMMTCFNDWKKIVHEDDLNHVLAVLSDHLLGKSDFHEVEYRVLCKDNSFRWIHFRGKVISHDQFQRPVRMIGTQTDITERKQIENKLRQSSIVFDNTLEGIVVTNNKVEIIAVNPAFKTITGYSEKEVLGKNPNILNSGKQGKTFYRQFWDSLDKTGRWQGEVWNRRKSGEIYPEFLTVNSVRDSTNKILNYIAVFSDISHIKQSEHKIERLAHYDPLTELPNRSLFYARLSHAIDRVSRYDSKLAVLFIDVDQFKTINDSLGHSVGDELLIKFSQRLSARIRKQDTLARLSGDKFILLLEDIEDIIGVGEMAEDLMTLFKNPFLLVENHEIYANASIGISIFPEDGQTADQLISHADAAMYQAKGQGRHTYCFYTKALTKKAKERFSLETQLRKAIQQQQFVLFYQPQVDIETGKIIGAEALVRWQQKNGQLISPNKFIPLAEETGLIIPLGDWILNEACKQAKIWLNQGIKLNSIAVNLSCNQFQQGNIVDSIKSVLQETELPAKYLELEITETAIMEQGEKAIETLKNIKALGVKLSIDDFGTGYSSLSYLKLFPLDKLKVDQGFVRDIPNDQNDMEITSTIISMAHGLSFVSLAEGVETKEQLDFLKEQRCKVYQGYFFSKPLPVEQFEALFESPVNKSK